MKLPLLLLTLLTHLAIAATIPGEAGALLQERNEEPGCANCEGRCRAQHVKVAGKLCKCLKGCEFAIAVCAVTLPRNCK